MHNQSDLERLTTGKRSIHQISEIVRLDNAHIISRLRFLGPYIGSRLSDFKTSTEKPDRRSSCVHPIGTISL